MIKPHIHAVALYPGHVGGLGWPGYEANTCCHYITLSSKIFILLCIHWVRHTVELSFHRCMNIWCSYEVYTSPALSRSLAIQCFEYGDTLETHDIRDCHIRGLKRAVKLMKRLQEESPRITIEAILADTPSSHPACAVRALSGMHVYIYDYHTSNSR